MSSLNFREQLKKDTQVFFNINEFAEKHTLMGKEILAIVDVDELKRRKMDAAEGTYVGEKVILVQKFYLTKRPVEGQKITYDEDEYYVLSCEAEGELYKITLGNNEPW